MFAFIVRNAPFALAVAALAGCSSNVSFGGDGDGGGGGGATSSAQGAGGSTTSSAGSGTPGLACSGPNSAGPATACTPQDAGCNPGKSVCAAVEVVDGAPSFALKMAHISFSKPAALSSGIAKSVLQNWLGPPPPVCHIPNFLLAWIFRFDLTAGTLTTGGARQGAGMAPGFQLIDDISAGAAITPVVAPIALGAGCDLDVTVGDLNVPIQYDPGFASNFHLPFRKLRLHGGKVSPDHNCIGVYNDALLSPGDACAPTDAVPAYTHGAQLDGWMSLEEADAVIISPLQQSLCVFLSQDAAAYGEQVDQYKLCARGPDGQIVFKGDWCSATDQPATAGCADAVKVTATFAASGVKMAP
uniref:Lipoprotein n=1 Tax=Phaselicystis flava TaxID=525924 RepID=A0A3S7V073_9BACT|nr:hypothetical protein [Phaselicystis flava]